MPYYVYVSLSAEDRINVYAMDPETGGLDSYAIVAAGAGPGPLCVEPQQRFLYAGLRTGRQAAAFRLDKGSGRLSPLGVAPLESDPCYLSTDARAASCSAPTTGPAWPRCTRSAATAPSARRR